MSDSVRKRMLLAVLLPLPLLLAVCGLLAWQVRLLTDGTQAVEHTRAVIAQAHYVQRLLIDQETGLRGYLLSGQPVFLEPYQQGQVRLPATLQELRRLTQDNAVQQGTLLRLDRLYTQWSDSVERGRKAVQLDRALLQRRDPAFLAEMTARKGNMDGMREAMSALVAEEERLLAMRKDEAAYDTRRVVVGGTVVLSILGLFLVWYLAHLIRRVDGVYRRALTDRDSSLDGERRARAAAEALAAEVTERSREMERSYTSLREERDLIRRRLADAEGKG